MKQFQQLYEDGIRLGMCEKFRKKWDDNTTLDDLCQMFYAGQDFCIEHNYPSIEQILSLDEKILENHGIYASGKHQVNTCRKTIILGNADVELTVPDYQEVLDIYVRHNAHLTLSMGKYTYAYISIFDDASVSVVNKGIGARLCASQFGGNIRDEELFDKISKKRIKK